MPLNKKTLLTSIEFFIKSPLPASRKSLAENPCGAFWAVQEFLDESDGESSQEAPKDVVNMVRKKVVVCDPCPDVEYTGMKVRKLKKAKNQHTKNQNTKFLLETTVLTNKVALTEDTVLVVAKRGAK